MEILESIAWITLGFAPVFGSMELAWRIHKKSEASRIKAKVKRPSRSKSSYKSYRLNLEDAAGVIRKWDNHVRYYAQG